MKITAAEWARVSRLLDEALEIEPGLRDSWLESLALEHADLRGTLRELLRAEGGIETVNFLPNLAHLVDRGEVGVEAGEHVGPYRLIRALGSGGMASVWLAERADGSLRREVALKLPRMFSDDRLSVRLARERDILARLEHPNIARLYDAGVDAKGRPFLAMEFVDGLALDVYCRERSLILRQRIDLFLQIARAVAFAHGRLIVHRDLKPANILVTASGEVRLLDFGIAQLLRADVLPGLHHTQIGGRVFTPAYAAPEQLTGQPVTVATDVYSLGVLLYELLAGKSPYASNQNLPGAMEESVLHQEPRPASLVAPVADRRALRGDLDAILAQALKKAPADRYASVEAFAADVERHLDGRPIHARAPSRWYVAKKFARRNAVAIGVGASIAAALVVGMSVALWQSREAARQRAIAVEHLTDAEDAADFMSAVLIEGIRRDESVSLEELLARSEAFAEGAGRGDLRRRAFAVNFVAKWYIAYGLFDRAEKFLTRNIASGSSAKLLCTRAEAWANLGRMPEAIAALDAEIARNAADPDAAAHCLLIRSGVATSQRDSRNALAYAFEAQRLAEAGGRQSPMEKAIGLGQIGSAYSLSDETGSAEPYFVEAMQLFERAGRAESDASVALRVRWGVAALNRGSPVEALSLFDAALAIARKRSPTGEPPAVIVSDRLSALRLIGRFDEARAMLDHATTLAERTGEVFDLVYILHARADIDRKQGRGDVAQSSLDEALATLDRAGVPVQNGARLRHDLFQAQVWAARGFDAQAARAFTAAIDRYVELGCCGSAQVLGYLGRGELALKQRRFDAAQADVERALKAAERIRGTAPHSSFAGSSWLLRARIHAAQGQADPARDAYRRASDHLIPTVGAESPESLQAKQGLTN